MALSLHMQQAQTTNVSIVSHTQAGINLIFTSSSTPPCVTDNKSALVLCGFFSPDKVLSA